ncbi:MAG: PorV/PorQ family protein [Candidatus Zixiibacteriota bacterium]
MLRALGCFVLALSLASGVVAGDGDGGYAAPWLQVPAGARPTAMGGAYLAVSDDGAAPLFNPAGLARRKRPMLASSYRAMKLDRKLGYVTAVFPVRGQSTLGVHWLYAGSGSVEARDSDGYLTGHDLSMNAHHVDVVFAKLLTPYLAAGANLNYILVDMPDIDANSVGFDFGAMLYIEHFFDREKRDALPIRDLQVGITAKNISKQFRFVSDEYNLKYTTSDVGTQQEDKVPVEVGIGVSGRLLDRHLLVASDFRKNEKQNAEFHAGAEYFVTPEFMLRGGYSDKRLTAGTGYLFHLGKKALSVDYAFSTDKVDEGSEHIFSFDLLF